MPPAAPITLAYGVAAQELSDNRSAVCTKPEERGMAKAENAGFAPEEIETQCKQAEDQRVAQNGNAVDIGRERVERQQHHDKDDDAGPRTQPCAARRYLCGHRRHDGTKPCGRNRTTITAPTSTKA